MDFDACIPHNLVHMYNTCINAICNVQQNSWFDTDAISHEFYKNGILTYQNSDNMSLSEIKTAFHLTDFKKPCKNFLD